MFKKKVGLLPICILCPLTKVWLHCWPMIQVPCPVPAILPSCLPAAASVSRSGRYRDGDKWSSSRPSEGRWCWHLVDNCHTSTTEPPPTGHFNHLQSNAHSLSIHCSQIFYGNCHCQNLNKRLVFPPTTHYWSSDNAGGWRSVLCQIHQKSSFNLNSEPEFTFLQRVESRYTDSSYTPS